jgi:hypothetical protein
MVAGAVARQRILGELNMLKTLAAVTMAFALTSGVSFAQSSWTSSTTQVTPPVAPSDHVEETTTTKRTSDRDGVMVEKTTEGTEVSTPGTPGLSQTTTRTTTTR